MRRESLIAISPPAFPPEGYGVRSRCTYCDGLGMRSELQLVWKQPRQGMPPLSCHRRVDAESEEEVAQRMAQLEAAGAVEIALVASAKPCLCRKPAEELPRPVGRPRTRQNLGAVLDWKTRAAGDN